LRPIAEASLESALQSQPQAEVESAAMRAQNDHLPVAERIAGRLDGDRGIGRQATDPGHLPAREVA